MIDSDPTKVNGNAIGKPASGWVVLLGPTEFELLAKIDSSPWVVYLALRWFARDKSTCYPKVETIGKLIHTKPRAVRYALDRLEAAGLIRREIVSGKGTTFHLLTAAIVCSPSDSRDATFGTPPLQLLVSTPATFGTEPLQELAAEEEERKSTQEQQAGKKTRRALRFDEADRETALWMFELIRELDQNARQPNIDQWANEIRIAREQDGRTDEQIRSTFKWANSDQFWKSNILSPKKLREKFTTLLTQSTQGTSRNGRSKQSVLTGPGQSYTPGATVTSI